MTPSTALKLVGSYSRLTREIKALSQQIGEHLDRCPGLDGKRLEMDEWGTFANQRDTDSKNRDKSTHLWGWYQPETSEGDGYNFEPHLVWEHVTAEIHGAECPHCYAAHQAIQRRKAARRQLAAVKAAMTRGGS